MTTKAVVTLVYGILIAGGGITGYVLAGSMPSLVSGGILGLLAIAGSIMMFMGQSLGVKLAAFATILVALFFAYQLVNALLQGGAMGRSAGILILSLIELAILFYLPTQSSQF